MMAWRVRGDDGCTPPLVSSLAWCSVDRFCRPSCLQCFRRRTRSEDHGGLSTIRLWPHRINAMPSSRKSIGKLFRLQRHVELHSLLTEEPARSLQYPSAPSMVATRKTTTRLPTGVIGLPPIAVAKRGRQSKPDAGAFQCWRTPCKHMGIEPVLAAQPFPRQRFYFGRLAFTAASQQQPCPFITSRKSLRIV